MGILSNRESVIFKTLAGYRNRMTHVYHEISYRELFVDICTLDLSDIKAMAEVLRDG